VAIDPGLTKDATSLRRYVTKGIYPDAARRFSHRSVQSNISNQYRYFSEFDSAPSDRPSTEVLSAYKKFLQQSEFKKPYKSPGYPEMEAGSDPPPGISIGHPQRPDNPARIDIDEPIGAPPQTWILDAFSNDIFCPGFTKEIVVHGTHPIYDLQTVFAEAGTNLTISSGLGTNTVVAEIDADEAESGFISFNAYERAFDAPPSPSTQGKGWTGFSIPEGRTCPVFLYWYGEQDGESIYGGVAGSGSLFSVDSDLTEAGHDFYTLSAWSIDGGTDQTFRDSSTVTYCSLYDNKFDVYPAVTSPDATGQQMLYGTGLWYRFDDPLLWMDTDQRRSCVLGVVSQGPMDAGYRRINLGYTVADTNTWTQGYFKGFIYQLNSDDKVSRVNSTIWIQGSSFNTYNTLSFTPPETDNYLIITSGRTTSDLGTNTTQYNEIRLLDGASTVPGTRLWQPIYEASSGRMESDNPYTTCTVMELTAGVQKNFHMQYRTTPTVGASGAAVQSGSNIVAIRLYGKQAYNRNSQTGAGVGTTIYSLTDAHPAGTYLILMWVSTKVNQPGAAGVTITVNLKRDGVVVQPHSFALPQDARWAGASNAYSLAQTMWIEEVGAGNFNHSIEVILGSGTFSVNQLNIWAVRIE
jgi:hypothetical protein